MVVPSKEAKTNAERASDNTIGRMLKKTFSNRIAGSNG